MSHSRVTSEQTTHVVHDKGKLASDSESNRQVIAGFVGIILAILVTGIVSVRSVRNVAELTDKLYRHPLAVSNAVFDAYGNLIAIHRAMEDVVLANTPTAIDLLVAEIDKHERHVYDDLEIVEARFLGQKEKVDEVLDLIGKWRPIRDEVIELMRDGKQSQAAAITTGKGADHIALITGKIDGLIEFAAGKAADFHASAKETTSQVIFAASASVLTAVVLSLSISVITLRILHHASHIRRQTEEQLRTLSAAVEQSPTTIVITDATGKIEYVNPRFTETTGYTTAEVLGQNPRILNSGDTPRKTFTQMWDTLTNGEVWRGDFHNKKKNGDTYWESATIAPIRDPSGKTTHFVAVKEDITQWRQSQADLLHAKESAEQANRAKSDFLANMSHEIRTPMTAILGYSEILAKGETEPDRIEAADTIKKNGQYLVKLINDILNLSKVESGKTDIELCGLSPHSILSDTVSLMRDKAEAKGLLLNVRTEGEIPETIHSDPIRLQQILINVVDNAIKFTETGSVQIVTRLLSGPEEQSLLRFDIIDTGIGIAQEDMEKVFQAFSQADASSTREHGGTGLGLTISRRLARALGGDVVASSTPGKGTTISVTIATGPLDNVRKVLSSDDAENIFVQTSPPVPTTETEEGQLKCRILLVEDGLDNQRMLSFILTKAGADVTLAENGQIALDAVDEASEPFDVILMDMQMPVLDGYEATRRLRDTGCESPIIALTAHAMTSDRQKCIDVGCDDYASKPIARSKLVRMVASYANLSDYREPEHV